MSEKINIDLERLEELAAGGLTQKQAAEELGIKPGTFFAKLSTDAELKEVWERGRRRFTDGSPHPPKPAVAKRAPKKASAKKSSRAKRTVTASSRATAPAHTAPASSAVGDEA